MTTTTAATTAFYVWHRKHREPVAGPFPTLGQARAAQAATCPGDPRVIVRRVEVEQVQR